MKKYYILRADGSSIFAKGYPIDFIYHCYYHLIDRSDEAYTVISMPDKLASVQLIGGTGGEPLVLALLEPSQQ